MTTPNFTFSQIFVYVRYTLDLSNSLQMALFLVPNVVHTTTVM